MSARIFRNIVLTALISVLLTAGIIMISMYTVYEERISSDLKLEAGYIRHALELTENDTEYLKGLGTENRITLIDAEGTVLFDNRASHAQMENHSGRPEIIAALEQGYGMSTRNSATVSQVTIYYAEKTTDGTIIRIASTRSSVLGAFIKVLPLMIALLQCIIVASILIARKTAQRIVAPINALNLDQPLENETYDELAPLLTRMNHQKEQLYAHVDQLEKARYELATLMENMREGFLLIDKNETVLSMNQSAGRIFGLEASGCIGQNLLYVYRDAELQRLVLASLRGEEGSFALKCNGKHYLIYLSPVSKGEEIQGTVMLVLDVTERFAAEESRREFTANVSHELKTPLASISGAAEIIRDGIAQQQDIPHFAGMICKEASRMITLVNDILELSKLDEQKNIGPKETVDLMPLLQEILAEVALPDQKKNQKVELIGENVEIHGYPTLLREMAFNLIDNAMKYTPEGGKISVSVEHTADGVCLQVADNGIGIPAQHQAHVFERFYRVDKSRSRATGGTGLGLAIVKHVAQIHNATLTLNSKENVGTTMSVFFHSIS